MTIAQGGTSATLKRVVLESGTYLAGTAAGRYIITVPSGGVFSAGALTTAAHGTVPAAAAGVYHGSQIALSPGGRVRTDRYTFTAALADQRLYGCDGINREFEFDGDILAPIVTGMGAVRASAVRCHKHHMMLAYRGSLQISGIGTPYVWSAVLGAAELGTGDEITNLLSIGGASDAAALFVLCRNALFVLYGNSSVNWNLVPLSRVSGALPDSAQDIGGVLALDTPGVMRYPNSQNFGNFAWDTVSMAVQPLTRTQQCACSVYASGLYRYRIFFEDGTAISGLPLGQNKVLWSVIDYGVTIVLAEHAEIDGDARTFYADTDGWVYEADKGRSFAGLPVQYALKLNPLNQRSPIVEKQYRQMVMEIKAASALTISTSAEFNDDDGESQQTDTPQYGAGLAFELANYDESYWDTARTGHKTVPLEGVGQSASVSIAGQSDNEMPHTVYALTILYTPRKIAR